MHRYPGPDAACREYLRLKAALESPQGYDPLDYADVCAACGGGPALPKGGGLKRDRWGNMKLDAQGRVRHELQAYTCAACGKPWEGVEVAWLKATGRHERIRDPEQGFRLEDRDRLMRLRPVFQDRRRDWTEAEWTQHRLAYFAYLDPRFGSFQGAAEIGFECFPGAPHPWSEGAVRWAVERMRRIVTQRLSESHLLAIPEGGQDVGRLSA